VPYWRLFYHFVSSTKNRGPLIARYFEQPLYNAIAAKVVDLGGIAHAVGGIADHLHLVASVPPKIALSTFIGQVKGSSSHFVNHEIQPEYKFAWQDEYGVVSFGERHLGWVVRYVHDQAQHHEQSTITERLERTLK
jgi:putative transposase